MMDFYVPNTKKELILALKGLYPNSTLTQWQKMAYKQLYAIYCRSVQQRRSQYEFTAY